MSDHRNSATHTTIGKAGQVIIPPELCRRYGLETGATVVLEACETGIMLRSLDEVIREVQAYFADFAPADTLVSEELIRERRAEVVEEDRE